MPNRGGRGGIPLRGWCAYALGGQGGAPPKGSGQGARWHAHTPAIPKGIPARGTPFATIKGDGRRCQDDLDKLPYSTSKQYDTMTTNNNAITSASAIADLLFEGATVTHRIAVEITSLLNSNGQDNKKAGKAIGDAWQVIGGDVETSQPVRLLIEACALIKDMTRKDTSKLVNAADIVSRQRVSQLIAVIFDGDTSKNKGKAAKEKAEKGEGEGKSQDGLDKLSFTQILAALKALPSITQEQAEIAATILASKIA